MAKDFFTVPTISFKILYVFFIIDHARRKIVHFNVTRHPTDKWIIQQLRNAFPFDSAPKYLIFDREFTLRVRQRIKDIGVKPKMTGYQCPWQNGVVQRFFPRTKKNGRPPEHSKRTIVNAIMYFLRAGCAWRLLPNDFPPHKTVYHYFRLWRKAGLWKKLHDKLRQRTRIKAGREREPSAGILDSQSVKTTDLTGEKGYDGGKKIKGRRRHIIVDVLGLLIIV